MNNKLKLLKNEEFNMKIQEVTVEIEILETEKTTRLAAVKPCSSNCWADCKKPNGLCNSHLSIFT